MFLLAENALSIARLLELGLGAGAFALVAWIVRHVTTRTIPNLTASFERNQQQQTETFERVLRETRVEFREVLENDRQRHHDREEALRNEFRQAINRFESIQQRVVDELDQSQS